MNFKEGGVNLASLLTEKAIPSAISGYGYGCTTFVSYFYEDRTISSLLLVEDALGSP